jgi:hypothetical protein
MSIAQLFYSKQAQCAPSRNLRGKRLLPRRRRKLLFERLEPRLLLSASPLSYTAASAANLTLKLVPGLTPTIELLDTTKPSAPTVLAQQPLADTSGVTLAGSNQTDTLTLDLSGGAFGPLPITYAGNGGQDSIRVIGDGTTAASYAPSTTDPTAGTIVAGGSTVSFTGVTPTDFGSLGSFTFTGSSGNDALNLSTAVNPSEIQIAGTLDGSAFESASVSTPNLTINTLGGDDTVTIAGNVSLPFNNLTIEGNNSLTVMSSGGSTLDTQGGGLTVSSSQSLMSSNPVTGLTTGSPTAQVTLTDADLSAGNIEILATSTVDATDMQGLLGTSTIDLSSTAQVSVGGASHLTATGNLSISASSTVNTTASPTAQSVGSTADAAVATSIVNSTAVASVFGSSALSVTGDFGLSATNTLSVTTTADASSGSAGVGVALSVVSTTTTASVADSASVSAASVAVNAASNDTVTTTAKSSPGGSTSNDTQTQNDLTNYDASTSDGKVDVAGAVAITDLTSHTQAFITASGPIASAGAVSLTSTSTDTAATTADGSPTGDTSGSTTGVGVAVAIDVTTIQNTAYIGGTANLDPTAVELTATLTATFDTEATAGQGAPSNVGVAGALALNVVLTDNEALIQPGANVNVNGADLTLTANSTTSSTAKALPNDGGGDPAKVGVGASVAFTYGENTTAASVGDNAVVTGAHNLSLAAASTNQVHTEAKSGAKGGTAVTPVVAISVADDDTHATLGTGSLLTIGGNFSANSTLTNGVQTTAEGDTESSNTGVGISIALSIVNDSSLATTGRDLLTIGGAVALMSSVISGSESTAKASVKGGEEDDGSGTQKVDNKTGSQESFADSEAKKKNPSAKGTEGASAPSASTADGSVSVAGAVAVNIENASSTASIPDGRHFTASGMVTVQSAANVDGHAVADGSASTGSGGTGVGAAVAINVSTVTNLGYVGNNTVISGGGLTVGAVMADRNVKAPVISIPVIDTSKDTIFLGLDAGLKSGDQVQYDSEGNTAIGGLTSGSSYFVNVQDDGTVKLYDTKDHAEAGESTGLVDLTSTGSGSEQKFNKYFQGVPNPLDSVTFNPTGSVRVLNLGEDALLRTGDPVTYDAAGGAAIGGLTSGTTYYIIDLTGGNYQLAASRDDAYDGKAITLTSDGNTSQQVVDGSHSSRADAASGAGGGKIGVAGSVAVNVVNNDTEAVVGLTPGNTGPSTASVTITGGGNVSVSAASDEANLSRARPSGDTDGDNVGVGASVAVNVLTNTVSAAITDGTSWSGAAGTFSVSATSGDSAFTHGENGASGSVAVGVGAAVAVVQDTTTAYVGTGSALSVSGDATIMASHTGAFKTTTDAEAAGTSVGVGASVSVAVVIENISAELARSLTTTGGAVMVSSTSTVSSDAEATATVKGEDKNDSEANSSGGKSGADGQADHQVNDNSTTNKGSETSLTSAKDTTSTESGKSSDQSGEGSSGVGVAAAVSVNVVTSNNTAKITHGANITAHNAVTVAAQSEDDASAKGIGASVAMDNNANIGAGVGLNVATVTNTAFVDAGSTVQGNGITIEAITPASTTDDFVAWGAAAAGGKGDVSVAGSVGINVLHVTTEASAHSGSHLESSGPLSVQAIANVNPQTLAAAGAFSEGTAVGAGVAVAVVTLDTNAYIAGNADAGGALSIDAENHVDTSKIDIPKLPDAAKPSATTVAVAGGASSGDVGVAGAVIVDDFSLNATADIGAGSQINQGGLYAPSSSQTLSITADNETTITSIAGALGLTTGSAGVGGSIDVEIIGKQTKAYIDSGATVSAGGTVSVTGTSTETMLSVVATLGVADSAGIAGSASVSVITTETDAYLGASTVLNAGGGVTLSATGTFKTTMIAGSVGAAGTAGIGVSNTTLVHTDTVQAYVGGSAHVTAGGTVSITATASEDILSIAAGIGGGGTVGVAGSAAVNVLNETTTAYVGPSATIHTTSGDLTVSASDDTSVISVAGSLAAAGTVAVGVGADVGVYTKHTNAYIDSGVTTDIAGNILVTAESSESLISVSAGVGVATVGVAANASVHVFNLETRAFIGDDPNNPSNAGAGDVHAHGSIALSANDETDANEIVGVLAAGEVGVGAAAGVDVITKDTEAFIGVGARVTGDGNGSGLTVDTGGVSIGSVAAPTFNAGNPSGVGIETSSSGTLSDAESGDRTNLQSAGQVNTPQIGQMDLNNSGSGQDVQDASLSGRRTASLDTQSGFHGVAVAASNRDEIRTFTVSLAGGIVGVAVSAGVDVVNATTQAYVGNHATVNGDTSGANAAQSVLVGAGDDFYHLAVAGTIAGGLVGVAPAVGVNIIGNTTQAYIDHDATVNALGDIVVEASGKENIVMIGFGIAAGAVGVGGAVDVLSIDNHTIASIGDSATVYAGGNVFVSATDDTHVLELSGALAGGFVGVGASVGVMLISTDTEATIGHLAHVDALGNGGGLTGILDGTITGGTSFETTTAHGVIVQAQSSEEILHIVAAGGAGFVGVSGAVGVTLIKAETDAVIESNALIDTLHQGSANADQSIYVNAANNANVQTFIIGVAGGFVGVAGAVDVGTLNNNTKAEVQTGATLNARDNIEINALSLKSLQGFDASGAGGFVGAGGAVSVWSIGTQIQKTTKDQNGSTTASGVDTSNGSADADAGNQAQGGSGLVTGSGGGGLGNFTTDSTGNSNTNTNRVQSATASAATSINNDAPTEASITNTENSAPTPPGTSAVVQSGASLNAGGAIGVKANESDTITVVAGQFAGGVVGIGASVAILSVADNVAAFADGTLSAVGNIGVNANLNEQVTLTALDGSAGFVGIGAAVVAISDSGLAQASLGNVTKAGDVTLSASDTRNLQELTGQISAGAVGAGASFTRLDITGGASAAVNANAQIGQSGTVNSLSVSANSAITANSQTVAVSAGIGAITANFAFVNVAPLVSASIGNGAEITVTGDVSVTGAATDNVDASVQGVAAGGLAVGASLASASVTPTVDAYVGAGAAVKGGSITLQALQNYDRSGSPVTFVDGSNNPISAVSASAQGSSGGLVGGVGGNAQATADATTLVYIDTGAAITATSGDVSLVSLSDSDASASAKGVGGGLVGVGEMKATADAYGTTEAFLNGIDAVTAGGNLTLLALGTNNAGADSNAVTGGVVGVDGANSTADAAPTVRAYAGTSQQSHAGGGANIEAVALGNARANAGGASGGVVGVGTSKSTAKWRPTVEAAVLADTPLSTGGTLLIQAFNNYDQYGNEQTGNEAESDSSATGGGVASIQGASSVTDVNASVDAHIGAGANLSAGTDLGLLALSCNQGASFVEGNSYGAFGDGSASSDVEMYNTVWAQTDDSSASDPTRLGAGNSITVHSESDNWGLANASGGAGGLVGAGSASATVELLSPLLSPLTESRLGNYTTVLAPHARLEVSAAEQDWLETGSSQTVTAGIANNETDATTRITNGKVVAEIGTGVSITVNEFVLDSDLKSVFAQASSDASVPFDLAGSNTATSDVEVNSDSQAHIAGGVTISAATSVTIQATVDSAQTHSLAHTATTGLTGSLYPTADNYKTVNAEVDVDPGSNITTVDLVVNAAAPHDEADRYENTPTADAQTVAQAVTEVVGQVTHTVCEVVGQVVCLWGLICNPDTVCNTITEDVTKVVQVITGSQVQPVSNGSETITNSVNFNANVTIVGGGGNPALTVDSTGTITRLTGITGTDGVNPIYLGDRVTSGKIILNAIANNGAQGSISLTSPEGATSGSSVIAFNTALGSVTIQNDSTNNLVVNSIEVFNATNPPTITTSAGEDAQGNSLNKWTYSLSTNATTSGINITNDSPADTDITLAGSILNPGGITTIQNIGGGGGDILATGSAAYIASRVVSLTADSGTVGTAANPLYVGLTASGGSSGCT